MAKRPSSEPENQGTTFTYEAYGALPQNIDDASSQPSPPAASHVGDATRAGGTWQDLPGGQGY